MSAAYTSERPEPRQGTGGRSMASPCQTITIAVAGNPNAGKSTLINGLAGTRLHVGNWPGVTVEKKEALFEFEGARIKIVDLPGTYSLSPYSQEEIIARDYLVHEQPDVIVNVVDATNLERNLYLTIQLMELGIPIVMALNIFDEAEKKGYKIDARTMATMLGIRVVPTVATKNIGLTDLVREAVRCAEHPAALAPKHLNYGEDLEAAARSMAEHLRTEHAELAGRFPLRWLAFKLLEGDAQVLAQTGLAEDELPGPTLEHLRIAHGEDFESLMADARYAQATGLTREVMTRPEVANRVELTERIDKVVLNRFFGIPIFFFAMWLVFKLTFDISPPLPTGLTLLLPDQSIGGWRQSPPLSTPLPGWSRWQRTG